IQQIINHDSLFNQPSQYWHMGVEENDDKPINLLEVQPEIPEQEPIEQVFSQEPEEVRPIEPSTESEDQQRFEETARFEEEIDTPKVEPKSEQKQVRKTKVTRKRPTRGVNEDKSISKLHDELRKHSDARKKAERDILNIKKELKDVLLAHHATIKDLQKQVAQMHRKIATIDSSKTSARVKTTAKKTTRNKKTSSSIKSKKKSGQNKSRKG
ncbi:MAG: hypothetical protein WBZ50_01860, partial [Nitrososphaeraceae archaeon]